MEQSERFQVGDVVRCVCEVSIHHNQEGAIEDVKKTPSGICYQVAGTSGGWFANNLTLIRRAAQPGEGKGEWVPRANEWVRVRDDAIIHAGRFGLITRHVIEDAWAVQFEGETADSACSMRLSELEPAPTQPAPAESADKKTHAGRPGGDTEHTDPAPTERHSGQLGTGPGQLQPVPMTRAARVLAGMMADPYKEIVKGPPAAEANRRQESARLRMAKMTLDKPLEYDQRRWERLVLAKVKVGRR